MIRACWAPSRSSLRRILPDEWWPCRQRATRFFSHPGSHPTSHTHQVNPLQRVGTALANLGETPNRKLCWEQRLRNPVRQV